MGGLVKATGKELLLALEAAAAEGWLTSQVHSEYPLKIFCYNQSCMFEQYWTKLNRAARGIVINTQTYEIQTRCMPKFFNVSERLAHPPKNGDYKCYAKTDGSMVNWSHYKPAGRWICTTKASFANGYVDYAMKYAYLFDNMPTDYSIVTEVVLPKEEDGMKRAVPHAPGLYLLAMIDSEGVDHNIGRWQGTWNGYWSRTYDNSIEELVQLANEETGTEGWVVRYSNGYRMKIKTAWYLRIFRMINKLDKGVNEQILAGKTLNEILFDCPEELHNDVTNYYEDVMSQVHCTREHAVSLFNQVAREMYTGHPVTRKEFALKVKELPEAPYLFKLYDAKLIDDMVLKQVIASQPKI